MNIEARLTFATTPIGSPKSGWVSPQTHTEFSPSSSRDGFGWCGKCCWQYEAHRLRDDLFPFREYPAIQERFESHDVTARQFIVEIVLAVTAPVITHIDQSMGVMIASQTPHA